jgi:hypothetical protein
MSKNRSELAYLHDILDAIQAIQDFTRGYDYELFVSDRKTRDAVVRNLEVIGGAVKKVSRIEGTLPSSGVEVYSRFTGCPHPRLLRRQLQRGLGNCERKDRAFEGRDRENPPG